MSGTAGLNSNDLRALGSAPANSAVHRPCVPVITDTALHYGGPVSLRRGIRPRFLLSRCFQRLLRTSVFFPAAGYRNYSNGTRNNVGNNGNYWSAVPNSTNNGRNLNFNSGNVNPVNNNNRSNGFSARPVQAFAWAVPYMGRNFIYA